MPLRITVDIFSGSPNPVLELDESESREVMSRMRSSNLATAEALTLSPNRLGYRGLVIEQVDPESEPDMPERLRLARGTNVAGTSDGPVGSDIEDFVLAPDGSIAARELPRGVAEFCQQECHRAREPSTAAFALPSLPLSGLYPAFDWGALRAPIYEPNWWNDGHLKQLNNNCYNYASNYRTDTFAQPGRGAGNVIPSLSCAGVKPLAIGDGLVAGVGLGNQYPLLGHLVALVIAPEFDFHWYRKDWGGLWSHKIGWNPATNRDNAGNLIFDPQLAARGPYTDFCGFLVVQPGHIKLT